MERSYPVATLSHGDPAASPLGVVGTQSVADQVYAVLRQRLASGGFEGGARLRQQDLAAEFSVSRTPVREALGRLAAEGLVELVAHRGARVVSTSASDMRNAYEARLIVEPGAARLAAARRSDTDLERMRSAIAKQRVRRPGQQQHFVANREFHLSLVAASGNEHVLAFMEQIWLARIGAPVYEQASETEAFIADVRAHEAITDAVTVGDASLAEVLVREHLERSLALLFAPVTTRQAAPD